jgi:hypothetical protein
MQLDGLSQPTNIFSIYSGLCVAGVARGTSVTAAISGGISAATEIVSRNGGSFELMSRYSAFSIHPINAARIA